MVKMTIAAEYGKGMLFTERGDPDVIRRNRPPDMPQFKIDYSVMTAGFLGDVQHRAIRKHAS